MPDTLIDPSDSLERQNEKLLKINRALMRRVEQGTDTSGAAYAQFQRAALLEEEVNKRTLDLEHAMALLNDSNAQLAKANLETEAARANLANAIETVQEGFALFDTSDTLVMCNSRFGLHMPDIHVHLKPGLTFQGYVDLISKSKFMALPHGDTPEAWATARMLRHIDDSSIFNVRMIWNRWVQVSEHRTPDGGTVILQTDVTDIMRLQHQERERMLDDQARLIRATLEHLDQGVCIFDNHTRLVGLNQQVSALLAIPARHLTMGTRFSTIFERFRGKVQLSQGISPETIEAWIASPDERPALNFELEDRTNRILAVHAQEMPDKGFVISFSDVTSERAAVRAIRGANELLEMRVAERTLELEDALGSAKRANASKSRFVAAASHDLLQPLSAAKLYIASLEDESMASPAESIAAKAQRALGSVEHILEALLDISNLDSGTAAMHVGPVPAARLLERLDEELQPVAKQKGLQLRIIPSSAIVLSDATYLRRILQNLIANAIRYTPKGKVIAGVRRRKNSVRFEVWDSGPGIEEAKQQLIFHEFQRLGNAASAAEGMGLGLAIVERACALLGHGLTLHSIPGQGSGFCIDVSLAARDTDHSNSNTVPDENIGDEIGDQIVLLIENDPDLQNALALSLERWNIGVLTSSTASEALERIAELGMAPDAIIADYHLDGDIVGTEVIANIRREYGNIPACVITANRQLHVTQACSDANLPLLHKPVAPEALRAFLYQSS